MNPLIVFKDIRTFFVMSREVLRGRYKMPWTTAGWLVLCVVYLLSPVDVLPDILPILGFADDGAFLVFVLLRLHRELAAFRTAQTSAQKPDIILDAEVVKDEKK